MNVAGERILIFGDSLTHSGSDGGPEIWDVDQGSGRVSSAPGGILASLLLEAGAQAVRTDANVGRSAANFWAGTSRHQFQSAAALVESDRAFAPTKVIVMLGTNDADVGRMDPTAIATIRDTYAGMGAEVIAIGPPVFASEAMNAKVQGVYDVLSQTFDTVIDARPLSSTNNRAGDGVHFTPLSAQPFAYALATEVTAASAVRTAVHRWWKLALIGAGAAGILGLLWWRGRPTRALSGAMVLVDGKRWGRGHSPAAAGYKQIPCKAGLPGLTCWTSSR